MANEQNLKKGKKFSAENQPARRGREKQFRTILLEALRKVKMKERTGKRIEKVNPDTGEIMLDEKENPIMEDEMVEIQLTEELYIQRAIEMSLYDPAMMRDILGRLIPYVKPTAPIYQFELKGTTAADRIDELTQHVADGVIPFDAAEVLVKMIRHGAEVAELSDLLERIATLEQLLHDSKK